MTCFQDEDQEQMLMSICIRVHASVRELAVIHDIKADTTERDLQSELHFLFSVTNLPLNCSTANKSPVKAMIM